MRTKSLTVSKRTIAMHLGHCWATPLVTSICDAVGITESQFLNARSWEGCCRPKLPFEIVKLRLVEFYCVEAVANSMDYLVGDAISTEQCKAIVSNGDHIVRFVRPGSIISGDRTMRCEKCEAEFIGGAEPAVMCFGQSRALCYTCVEAWASHKAAMLIDEQENMLLTVAQNIVRRWLRNPERKDND